MKTAYGCNICVKVKNRKSYTVSLTKASAVGHLHADTKGKMFAPSVRSKEYFVTIIDEFLRIIYARPVKCTADVSFVVLHAVRWFEKQTIRSF